MTKFWVAEFGGTGVVGATGVTGRMALTWKSPETPMLMIGVLAKQTWQNEYPSSLPMMLKRSMPATRGASAGLRPFWLVRGTAVFLTPAPR